jgi:hypothetical protein
MEQWQVYFNNGKGLRIRAKKKDLVRSKDRIVQAKTVETETETEENIYINLDNVSWIMNVGEIQDKN